MLWEWSFYSAQWVVLDILQKKKKEVHDQIQSSLGNARG